MKMLSRGNGTLFPATSIAEIALTWPGGLKRDPRKIELKALDR